MKNVGLLSLLIGMGIVAFLVYYQADNRGKGAATSPAGGGDYARMEEKAREAAGKANLTLVQAAVNNYRGNYDKWPASLEELKTAGLLDRVPQGIRYNPETGNVTAE